MTQYVPQGSLQIAQDLFAFIADEVCPGTDIPPEHFWTSLEKCLQLFSSRNKQLLETRHKLQTQIDDWHIAHPDSAHDTKAYKQFLLDIGYLVTEKEDFLISQRKKDPEVSSIAGPQLVVPVMNARYALNATNARWGSLYDALYSTDVINDSGATAKGNIFNPERARNVVEYVMQFFDDIAPLQQGSYKTISGFAIKSQNLHIMLEDGRTTQLKNPAQFAGFTGDSASPASILLHNHGLHIELQIDPDHPIAKFHPAGIKDVIMEAAITTIQDLEDSVAAVDSEDKVIAYRNWLGLMQGNLSEELRKGGKTITRKLNADREYTSPDGKTFTLPGRSLMLVRNVGHHLITSAVLDSSNKEIPEGILDGMVTTLIAMHDLKATGPYQNSRTAHIYIVKPKMHGPDEFRFTNDLFDFIEDSFRLERFTLQMGVMDEERRTSINLKECIRTSKERLAFINTGFLDRTGDEIHTSMEAGPVVPKNEMKHTVWFNTYEQANVAVGIKCGLVGNAQIGKGMWAMPDEMKQMVDTKITQLLAGANTAWVPSPTAAVLHAMHYHRVNVREIQDNIASQPLPELDNLLILPLAEKNSLTAEKIQEELNNNVQSILGYVVRWINQGIGCSKVPDIHNTGLMEDRATLRISSQHIANWLHHMLCDEQQVKKTLIEMARKVDAQNSTDPTYQAMGPDYENSVAFNAATDLIMKGWEQPNGYTEPLLYQYRRQLKSQIPHFADTA